MSRAPKPGDTWRWKSPAGDYREMFVERIQDGPGLRRAMGVNPKTGKRLQCVASMLAKGSNDAELVSVAESYVWRPTRPGR